MPGQQPGEWLVSEQIQIIKFFASLFFLSKSGFASVLGWKSKFNRLDGDAEAIQ